MRTKLIIILLLMPAILFANSKPFHCFGTHPKWTMNIGSKHIDFKSAKSKDIQIQPAQPTHAAGQATSYMRIYLSHLKNSNKKSTLVIRDNPMGCTDGESNELNGYDALVILPNKVYSGCCNIVENANHEKTHS